MLSVSRTVAAVMVAPAGTVMAFVAVAAALGEATEVRGTALVALIVGAAAAVAGLVLVLPVLMLAPRLRQLPWWVAALWGAAVALLVTMVLDGPLMTSRLTGGVMAALGAAAGLTYSLAARALMRSQSR